MADPFTAEEEWQEKRPPMQFIGAAALAVAIAYGLLFWSDMGIHVAGYLLGSVICIGLVGVFFRVDTKRRTCDEVVYIGTPAVRLLWPPVLIAGIVACAIHAYWIASALAVRS